MANSNPNRPYRLQQANTSRQRWDAPRHQSRRGASHHWFVVFASLVVELPTPRVKRTQKRCAKINSRFHRCLTCHGRRLLRKHASRSGIAQDACGSSGDVCRHFFLNCSPTQTIIQMFDSLKCPFDCPGQMTCASNVEALDDGTACKQCCRGADGAMWPSTGQDVCNP